MIIELFISLIGVLTSVFGCIFVWNQGHWAHYFYRAPLLFLLGYIIGLILAWCLIWLIGRFYKRKKPYEHVHKFAKLILNSGITYITNHALILTKVIGKEKIPSNQRFLMVCNHKSNFDSFLISKYFGKYDLGFISKESNMRKIPLAGPLMRANCYLAIDRSDKLQSLEVMKRAIHYVENNISSIVVFPEGTRQKEDVVLGPFHEGVFNIALKGNVPIVITTVKGTKKISKNAPFRFSKTKLEVIGVIYPDEFGDKTCKEISDQVHQIMYDDLIKE